MNLTIKQILEIRASIRLLSHVEMGASLAYDLSLLSDEIQPHIEAFDKAKNAALDAYGGLKKYIRSDGSLDTSYIHDSDIYEALVSDYQSFDDDMRELLEKKTQINPTLINVDQMPEVKQGIIGGLMPVLIREKG